MHLYGMIGCATWNPDGGLLYRIAQLIREVRIGSEGLYRQVVAARRKTCYLWPTHAESVFRKRFTVYFALGSWKKCRETNARETDHTGQVSQHKSTALQREPVSSLSIGAVYSLPQRVSCFCECMFKAISPKHWFQVLLLLVAPKNVQETLNY